jgi:hypothetical protein
MDDLDAIGQLIFFVLIVAGWVIKAIVEAKRAKEGRGAPAPGTEQDPAEASRPEGGVRPRRRPQPEAVSPPAPSPGPLGTAARLGRLEPGLAGRMLDAAAGSPSVAGRVLTSSAAAVAHGERTRLARRASVARRLSGGQVVEPGRDLTRAGVLWSEILGPCRALRGPHRSPAATRHGRG